MSLEELQRNKESQAWRDIEAGLTEAIVEVLSKYGIHLDDYTFIGDVYQLGNDRILHVSLLLRAELHRSGGNNVTTSR